MYRYFMCLEFVLGVFFIKAQTPQQISYRDYIKKSVESEEITDEIIDILENKASTSNLEKGYLGIVYLFKSKHISNPFSKYKYFKKGKKLLHTAISNNPTNIELRFYRLVIQDRTPVFLNYKSDMQEDRDYIIRAYPTLQDEDLKKRINKYDKVIEDLPIK